MNKKKKIIIILLTIFFLIGSGFLLYFIFSKKGEEATPPVLENRENLENRKSNFPINAETKTVPEVSKPIIQYEEGKKAGFYAAPAGNIFSRNQEINLEIKINTDEALVSATAIRFFIKADSLNAMKLNGQKMVVNTDLTSKGWTYPVNKIEEDRINNRLVGELAAVYISTTGFNFSGEKTIATLNISGVGPTKFSLEFDPEQTKFMTKTGKEIKLETTGGKYEIN